MIAAAPEAKSSGTIKLRTEIITDITRISSEAWSGVYPDVLESYSFFKTLQESGLEQFEWHYILVYDFEELVGIAPCFLMHYPLDTTIQGPIKAVLLKIKKRFPRFMELRALVCGLLGIKNISTLIAAFRKKKEDAEKSDDVKVKEDMLLYVDNFAMAITVMMFIKQFVDDKVGRGKNMQNLENIVRDLFMNVGSVTLELDPKDKFKSVKEIGQRCEKFYNANARVKEMMNNVNVDEEGNYIGPAVQYVPKVARPQDLAALGKQFIF